MKQFLFKTIALVCIVCSMVSCSDDNDPKKITLPKDQPSSVTVYANATNGTINFNAAGAWSAYISTQSRSSEEIDWLTLYITNGNAGNNVINYSLEKNNTGSSRTAYIIIICEDEQISIKITQSSEDDPNGDVPGTNANGEIKITCERYNENNGEGYYLDGTYTYELNYSNGRPIDMIAKWRDDMASGPGLKGDSYCLNVEETRFEWGRDEVRASIRNNVTYYPSGKKEVDISEHYAALEDGYAVSGWYRWDEDETRTDWKATYDSNGYLTQTQNNDATSTWDTFKFTWKDKCITKIDWKSEKYITINYNDNNLVNRYSQFDINWVLFPELEIYDFAAGDITRIWAACGLMGKYSNLLITEITEYDGHNTRSYRMDYKSADPTEIRVTEFVDGIQESYADWTIEYYNIH